MRRRRGTGFVHDRGKEKAHGTRSRPRLLANQTVRSEPGGRQERLAGRIVWRAPAAGVRVADGFATTADAYWRLLEASELGSRLQRIFADLNPEDLPALAAAGQAARSAVLETPLLEDVKAAIESAFDRLSARLGRVPELAVRLSATAEDLAEASFAGAAETFLNVRGRDGLLRAVHQCYSWLFKDRAISYRARMGFDQLKVALSVGVMPMVRSDKASSGIIFTLDPESGFREAVIVSGALADRQADNCALTE